MLRLLPGTSAFLSSAFLSHSTSKEKTEKQTKNDIAQWGSESVWRGWNLWFGENKFSGFLGTVKCEILATDGWIPHHQKALHIPRCTDGVSHSDNLTTNSDYQDGGLCVSAQAPCEDQVDNCEQYGAYACVGQYEAWARDHCQKTCGYCPVSYTHLTLPTSDLV